MPRLRPWTPIFDNDLKYGDQLTPGATVGFNPCPTPDLSYLGFVNGINGAAEVAVISPTHVAVSADVASMTYVVDVSSPTPLIVGSVATNSPRGLAYSDNHLFVCQYPFNPTGGLYPINVTVPASPTTSGTTPFTSSHLDGIRDVCISGTVAYVICETDRVISCLDISTPASPTELGFIANYAPHAGGFSICNAGPGLVAFVAWSSNSFGIANVSNPASPTVIGSLFDGTNLGTAYDVQVRGQVAYVCAKFPSQFTSIDISTPTAPVILDTISIPTAFSSGPYGVAIRTACPYAYVVTQGGKDAFAIDISDPSDLSVTDTFLNPTNFESPEGVAISADGAYLYVAEHFNDGLVVLATHP